MRGDSLLQIGQSLYRVKLGNRRFGCVGMRRVANVRASVTRAANRLDRAARHVGVEQEMRHVNPPAGSGAPRPRVPSRTQGGTNVVCRQVVFAGDFLDRHPAGDTTGDDRDRDARAANDGSAVAFRGVDFDTVDIHDFGL